MASLAICSMVSGAVPVEQPTPALSKVTTCRVEATITIGDVVQVGPYVQFLTPTHPVEAEPRRAELEAAKPIVVGDNVWLGGAVIVCPGVSIGENTVVGNPARVIRSL